MRYLGRRLDVVELAALHRFPVRTRLRTPPVDLIRARCAEDRYARRPLREGSPELRVDVEVSGRGGVEAGEDSRIGAACLP
jgi:hypothetical protein